MACRSAAICASRVLAGAGAGTTVVTVAAPPPPPPLLEEPPVLVVLPCGQDTLLGKTVIVASLAEEANLTVDELLSQVLAVTYLVDVALHSICLKVGDDNSRNE